MKKHITETLEIPEGISCSFSNETLTCSKDGKSLEHKINVPGVEVKLESNRILLDNPRGNKASRKILLSHIAHISNLFHGLNEGFTYELEVANVHFPMTVKVEGSEVIVTNYLGEKTPRKAKILPNVEVKIAGPKITVNSPSRTAAGQTAANLERATKINNRDRRIFQDGIFITLKPRRHE